MTEKEFRKLNRTALIEMLIAQSREVEQLKQQIAELQGELASREIKISKAGSIAEACMELNGVCEAVQKAADQYLYNVLQQSGQ